MSCPKNPKKFLIFIYEGPCSWRDTYVTKALTKGKFHVTQQCQNCGSSHEAIFISSQAMIRYGYDMKKLNAMNNFGSSDIQSLK